MYQKNLFGSRYRLSGNAQKTSHNSQTFFKRERWYLLFNNWFIFRLSPTLPEYKIKRKSLRATLESVAAGSFSWKAGARWGAGWGGISLLCLLMPPSCRFNGHVRLGGHGGADPNHTDGIIFSIRRRVCLEEKVKQKGSQVLFRCLVCCQNPNEMDVLLLELQDMLLRCVTQLHYLLTDECEWEQEEMCGKPRLLCHNTMLGMQENSRRIATAAPSAAPTCGFDEGDEVGVWQSPLLNTLIVSKNLLRRPVAPSEKKRWSVFLPLPASSCRVQEITFYYYLFYEMLRLQLRLLGVKCVDGQRWI